MPKFIVKVHRIVIEDLHVEADSPEEAANKAKSLVRTNDAEYHDWQRCEPHMYAVANPNDSQNNLYELTSDE